MPPKLIHSLRRRPRNWADSSDKELLAELCAGEEQALDELMTRKSGQLLGLARRLVGDDEEARDIVQMTFVRAWEHRASYNSRWSVNTWLYRIASNLAIDHLRSRRSRENRRDSLRYHLSVVQPVASPRGLAGLHREEVERILEELLRDLSDRQRVVFHLREIEGLDSKVVGKILGLEASTVRNHLFAARRHLRRALRKRYPEYGKSSKDSSLP